MPSAPPPGAARPRRSAERAASGTDARRARGGDRPRRTMPWRRPPGEGGEARAQGAQAPRARRARRRPRARRGPPATPSRPRRRRAPPACPAATSRHPAWARTPIPPRPPRRRRASTTSAATAPPRAQRAGAARGARRARVRGRLPGRPHPQADLRLDDRPRHIRAGSGDPGGHREGPLLVREEIALAKAELTEKVTGLVKGAAVGVAAGIFVARRSHLLPALPRAADRGLSTPAGPTTWLGYLIVARRAVPVRRPRRPAWRRASSARARRPPRRWRSRRPS